MGPNPVLRRLGFASDDRAVIVGHQRRQVGLVVVGTDLQEGVELPPGSHPSPAPHHLRPPQSRMCKSLFPQR